MAKVQATLDKDANPPEQTEANPQGIDTSSSATTYPPHPLETSAPPVKVAVISKEDMEKDKPIDWSEVPPETRAKLEQFSGAPLKPLRIQTPDGNIRIIYVPAGREYKDGDIGISEEEASWPTAFPPWGGDRVMSVQVSDIPEGETIESYFEKKRWATALGLSIEEVERMMESGTIPQPNIIARSPVKEFIDHDHLFHSHDHDDHSRSGGRVDDALQSGEHQAEVPVSDGELSEDTRRAPVPAHVLRSPSNLFGVLESSHYSITGGVETKTPTPPTTDSIETQLNRQLSPERFDKAQQLIDEYGTEEELRRLREIDPEAARRFERERRPSEPSRDAASGDAYSDGQSSDDAP